MKVIFFLVIAVIVLFLYVIYLRIKCIRLRNFYSQSQKDIKNLIKTFQKVRYGQLDARIENLENQKLQKSVNRLLETILDREDMIKEYQHSLSEKNASLEKMIKLEKESQKLKEDFIATLTHDLKVPIIAELNTIDFFLSGRFGDINDKQKEALKLMKNSNEELIELSAILLETYKIQQESIVLNKRETAFDTFVEEIVQEMKPISVSNSLNLEFFPSDTSTTFLIDRLHLKRVLKNLILNAISFSNHGAGVQVKNAIYGDFAVVEVVNEGIGISKEDADLIFNKYYSSAKKFRKVGTGLGLYLANQIVKAHNGTIMCKSEDGKTVFTVKIPL